MRRLRLHRPSAATVISLIALFFAMSGTAVAATGGRFILGMANTATSVSSLTNSKGTALSLSSTATTPPLTVSNSVQVPNLNASELDGQTASAFLPATGTAANSSELGGQPASAYLGVNGTAANSSELGGQPASAYLGVNGTAANSSELGGTPASGFIQGGGTISHGAATLTSGNSVQLVSGPTSSIVATCGGGPSDFLNLEDTTPGNELATWYNVGGVGQTTLTQGSNQDLEGTSPVTTMIWVQVQAGTSTSTYTLTESANSSNNTCSFTGQVITSNG